MVRPRFFIIFQQPYVTVCAFVFCVLLPAFYFTFQRVATHCACRGSERERERELACMRPGPTLLMPLA